MGEPMSKGEEAYQMFLDFPGGLLGAETLLVMLQNRINDRLEALGLAPIRLEIESDLKTLSGPAASAALESIPTLRQMKPPSSGEVSALL